MPKIFISYRREDSAGFAGRLADALEARYGADSVFRDVDDIRPGSDFVDTLHAALASCDVLIPLIGPRWLSAAGAHGQRLHDPQDYVRREIAIALEQGMTIIPTLVEGARMPATSELPAELAELARRQALVLGDHSWSSDVQALMRAIETVVPHDRPAGISSRSSSGHPPAIPNTSRRRLLWLGAITALGLSAFAAWHFTRLPQLEGDWHLDDGNRWRVRQEGAKLQIEEVHHESREVWRAGSGVVTREGVTVDLRYQFQPEVTLHGSLNLSANERALDGILIEAPSGRKRAFNLRR